MVKQHAFKPKRQHKPRPKKKLISPGMLVGIFLGFLMITSIFGFLGSYTQDDGTSLTYNGITFQRTNLGYTATVNDVDLEFSYFPDSVIDLNISSSIVETLSSTTALTVTYDPTSAINQSAALIQFNLEQLYDEALGIFVTRALTDNTLFPVLPNATCADATPFVPVMVLEHGNVTEMRQDGSCIYLTATSDSQLVRLHDRLAFSLLGVIE